MGGSASRDLVDLEELVTEQARALEQLQAEVGELRTALAAMRTEPAAAPGANSPPPTIDRRRALRGAALAGAALLGGTVAGDGIPPAAAGTPTSGPIGIIMPNEDDLVLYGRTIDDDANRFAVLANGSLLFGRGGTDDPDTLLRWDTGTPTPVPNPQPGGLVVQAADGEARFAPLSVLSARAESNRYDGDPLFQVLGVERGESPPFDWWRYVLIVDHNAGVRTNASMLISGTVATGFEESPAPNAEALGYMLAIKGDLDGGRAALLMQDNGQVGSPEGPMTLIKTYDWHERLRWQVDHDSAHKFWSADDPSLPLLELHAHHLAVAPTLRVRADGSLSWGDGQAGHDAALQRSVDGGLTIAGATTAPTLELVPGRSHLRFVKPPADAEPGGEGEGEGEAVDEESGEAPFSHVAGEVRFDDTDTLWVCVADGMPGAWRAVAGPEAAGVLHLLPAPVRVYDTRPDLAPLEVGPKEPLVAGRPRSVDLRGNGSGLPAGATAAMVSVTATRTVTGTGGWLVVYRDGIDAPGTSNLNWTSAGQTIAVTTVTAVDDLGRCSVLSGSGTDVVVDVLGYYR